MLKNLTLPKGAKEELSFLYSNDDAGTATAGSDDDDEAAQKRNQERQMLRELYGEGRYHMIPSFFKLMVHLRKQK